MFLNLRASMNLVGIPDEHILVTCIDKKVFEKLNEKTMCRLFLDDTGICESASWSLRNNSAYQKLLPSKFKSIASHITQPGVSDLVYVDSDIVFLRNPKEYLEICSCELAFQSEQPKNNQLCAGFVLLKNTTNTHVFVRMMKDYTSDDQKYINALYRKGELKKTVILPHTLFPNGHYFTKTYKSNPYIVHANWIIGLENKIEILKDSGLWYL